MLFVSDCAQGARNVPLCLAVERVPVSDMVASGKVETVAGMFQIAQWLPYWSMPASMSVVSRKVMANDIVPAGASIHSRSGLTPFPRPPTVLPDSAGVSWQVYFESKCAPSARCMLVSEKLLPELPPPPLAPAAPPWPPVPFEPPPA